MLWVLIRIAGDLPAILMSIYNSFYEDLTKIIFQLISSNMHLISSEAELTLVGYAALDGNASSDVISVYLLSMVFFVVGQ